MKKNIFIGLVLVGILVFLASCYTPSPLYGTWQDNTGSKITFVSDGTYSSTIPIYDKADSPTDTASGEWQVNDNVLVLSRKSGGSFVTEWEIRGSILYFMNFSVYGSDGTMYEKQNMTLYRISK